MARRETKQKPKNPKGEEGARKQKPRRRWSQVSYTARVTISFALISVMTTVVAIVVLSVVWNQHFQTYTSENMQSLANNTSESIAKRYEKAGEWNANVLAPASDATEFAKDAGVQVVSSNNVVLFDSSQPTNNEVSSLTPIDSGAAHVVQSSITLANGTTVGSVRVWVYGSDTMLTQSDAKFRTDSYQAIALSFIVALVISLLVGFMFSRSLVDPVRRITDTARAVKEGDLGARTNLRGDDEISKLGETFDSMADKIEGDRELERRLTTDVAHELRTPLMAVQATVEAMVDGVYEMDQERLETVDSEVVRLSRLVDALLKLSRLENPSVAMDRQKLNVGELIQTIVSTHEAYVHDAGLYLHYEADPDVYIYGDADMIRQATANLVSNAVRYTKKGGITIKITRGDSMAAIMVQDTGIGLSPEEAKRVFDRFWRAQPDRNRSTGGLGIGLSVVKEIVARHGGWVRVEGKKGEGAAFTMYIPLYDEERAEKDRKTSE